MKHLLLNSAMMPSPGNYSLRELSAADFGIAVKAAYLDGTLVSYIGYQQTADLISDLAGVPIPLNRAETHERRARRRRCVRFLLLRVYRPCLARINPTRRRRLPMEQAKMLAGI